MTPAYVHLWMIMHPLEGQEMTIQNNLTDLASWLVKIVNQIHKQKVQLLSVYIEFATTAWNDCHGRQISVQEYRSQSHPY